MWHKRLIEGYSSSDAPRHRSLSTVRSKRLIDTALVVLSMPLVLPVAATAAMAILVTDGSPVLFRQKRLGYMEREFDVFKFRTMTAGNGRDGDRDRITSLGAILRKASLDELPQLLNVLRGEMALVGPRPLYVEYLPHYTERERTRHDVRPGITGNAQVNGRNSARWPQRLELDAVYVEDLSLRADLVILLRTLTGVLKRDGVSLVARDTGEPLHIERSYPCEESARLRRINVLDVDTRVQWMKDHNTARFMHLPDEITYDSTLSWLAAIQDDVLRDDFVVADEATGVINAMLGLKSEPGSSSGLLYIFTDPTRRGCGLGSQAMRLLIAWARESRYESIALTVDKNNLAAVRLYRSMGFEFAGALEDRHNYELEV